MAAAKAVSFDLMPDAARSKFIRRRKKRLLIAAIRTAVVLCLFQAAVYFAWSSWTCLRISNLQEKLDWLSRQTTKAEDLSRQIEAKENDMAAIAQIRQEKKDWAAILLAVESQQPADLWLDSFSAGPGKTVQIAGSAKSLTELGAYLYGLNSLPQFEQFILVEAKEAQVEGVSLVEFRLLGKMAAEQ